MCNRFCVIAWFSFTINWPLPWGKIFWASNIFSTLGHYELIIRFSSASVPVLAPARRKFYIMNIKYKCPPVRRSVYFLLLLYFYMEKFNNFKYLSTLYSKKYMLKAAKTRAAGYTYFTSTPLAKTCFRQSTVEYFALFIFWKIYIFFRPKFCNFLFINKI